MTIEGQRPRPAAPASWFSDEAIVLSTTRQATVQSA